MSFVSLKNVVGKVLKENNLITSDIDAYQVFNIWGEIVGERLAEHSKPVRISEHKLYVEVDDPLWLAQVKYMKIDIIEKIDRRIKKGTFKDLKFFLKGF